MTKTRRAEESDQTGEPQKSYDLVSAAIEEDAAQTARPVVVVEIREGDLAVLSAWMTLQLRACVSPRLSSCFYSLLSVSTLLSSRSNVHIKPNHCASGDLVSSTLSAAVGEPGFSPGSAGESPASLLPGSEDGSTPSFAASAYNR